MSPYRNTLAEILARYSTPPPSSMLAPYVPTHNAFADYPRTWDYRPKSEWVSGHFKLAPHGLYGWREEWVDGYWRRSTW